MLLEVKNLGIAYGDKPPIVQGVTFNLDEGEILAIVDGIRCQWCGSDSS